MSTVSGSGLPSTRKALTYWNTFRVKSLGAIRIAQDTQGDAVRIVVFCFLVFFVYLCFGFLVFFPEEEKIKGRFYCCLSVPRAGYGDVCLEVHSENVRGSSSSWNLRNSS